ncbi:MAG: hypothetical protein ACR2G8_03610, partial [Candidatus Limnocylindria bacterium]
APGPTARCAGSRQCKSSLERAGRCAARVGERMYLAVRGKPRVALIDPGGRAVRDLPLPGIPVLVAGSI